MKKQQRDAFRIHHRVQASELIADFIKGKQLNDLFTDKLLASGVERQLEIIGEAASHVSDETQAEWPAVSWRQMKGAHNFIAHEYFRSDYSKIWDTVQHVLPHELGAIKAILVELEARYGSPEDDV